MLLLIEALAAAAVAGPLVFGLMWLRRRRARWRPFYRATRASGVQVGLERAGSRAIDIASLDPHADDFSDRLAAARAEAAENVATDTAESRNRYRANRDDQQRPPAPSAASLRRP